MLTSKVSFRQRMRNYRRHPGSFILFLLMSVAALIAVFVIVLLIGYILVNGIPSLIKVGGDLFAWKYTTDNQSMTPALINTVIMVVLTLIVSVPLGVGAAIYTTEYAKRGNKLVKVVQVTAETLSGIPSIVYGLFGFLMFNVACQWGYSMLSGVLTLAIMVLPLIMRTTEEALQAVPDSYREGSFGLGAGRLRTVFRITLPTAMPGILAGIILAIGRVMGETAALIFTSGTTAKVPNSLFSSTRTLAIHLYAQLNEGLYMEQAYATAVVLLVLVIAVNALSSLAAKKLTRK